MIEHLPPGNAYERSVHGPWGDQVRMMREVETRMRELIAVQSATYALLSGVYKAEMRILPINPIQVPGPARDKHLDTAAALAAAAVDELVADELEAVMHPQG